MTAARYNLSPVFQNGCTTAETFLEDFLARFRISNKLLKKCLLLTGSRGRSWTNTSLDNFSGFT